jgi:hypothetical protein
MAGFIRARDISAELNLGLPEIGVMIFIEEKQREVACVVI